MHLINTYKFETDYGFVSDKESLRNKFLISWILYLLKSNSYKNGKYRLILISLILNH
jgi:hypothetical protein